MQFPGYWVSCADGRTMVNAHTFDETELSDASDWTEAWQNEDPSCPQGHIDPLAMLHAVCRSMAGELSEETAADFRSRLLSETGCEIGSLTDLARLIQLTVPQSMKQPLLQDR